MAKQKYKPAFPTSRIKQIMRTDEEVGRVAAGALVCVSKSLELFIQHVLSKTVESLGGEKKITLLHLKNAVYTDPSLDFLKDIVSSEPRKLPAKEKRPKEKTADNDEEQVDKKIKLQDEQDLSIKTE